MSAPEVAALRAQMDLVLDMLDDLRTSSREERDAMRRELSEVHQMVAEMRGGWKVATGTGAVVGAISGVLTAVLQRHA